MCSVTIRVPGDSGGTLVVRAPVPADMASLMETLGWQLPRSSLPQPLLIPSSGQSEEGLASTPSLPGVDSFVEGSPWDERDDVASGQTSPSHGVGNAPEARVSGGGDVASWQTSPEDMAGYPQQAWVSGGDVLARDQSSPGGKAGDPAWRRETLAPRGAGPSSAVTEGLIHAVGVDKGTGNGLAGYIWEDASCQDTVVTSGEWPGPNLAPMTGGVTTSGDWLGPSIAPGQGGVSASGEAPAPDWVAMESGVAASGESPGPYLEAMAGPMPGHDPADGVAPPRASPISPPGAPILISHLNDLGGLPPRGTSAKTRRRERLSMQKGGAPPVPPTQTRGSGTHAATPRRLDTRHMPASAQGGRRKQTQRPSASGPSPSSKGRVRLDRGLEAAQRSRTAAQVPPEYASQLARRASRGPTSAGRPPGVPKQVPWRGQSGSSYNRDSHAAAKRGSTVRTSVSSRDRLLPNAFDGNSGVGKSRPAPRAALALNSLSGRRLPAGVGMPTAASAPASMKKPGLGRRDVRAGGRQSIPAAVSAVERFMRGIRGDGGSRQDPGKGGGRRKHIAAQAK
jgi:hypothetical protein